MANLLVPGEGLLVGSFARALFLVHSECAESAYINSRPFRVNAGPVGASQRGRLRNLVSMINVQRLSLPGAQRLKASQVHMCMHARRDAELRNLGSCPTSACAAQDALPVGFQSLRSNCTLCLC